MSFVANLLNVRLMSIGRFDGWRFFLSSEFKTFQLKGRTEVVRVELWSRFPGCWTAPPSVWLPCPGIPPFRLTHSVHYTSACRYKAQPPCHQCFAYVAHVNAVVFKLLQLVRLGYKDSACRRGRGGDYERRPQSLENRHRKRLEKMVKQVPWKWKKKSWQDGRDWRGRGREAGVLGQRGLRQGGGHRHGGRTHTYRHHNTIQPGSNTQGQKLSECYSCILNGM